MKNKKTNKSRCKIAVAAIITAAAFASAGIMTGCQSAAEYISDVLSVEEEKTTSADADIETTTERTETTSIETTAEIVETTESETSVPESTESRDLTGTDDSAWKQAYIDRINQEDSLNNSINFKYYLIYINDDDVPELVIDYMSSMGGASVLTYNDNIEEISVITGFQGIYYFERENKFLNTGGQMSAFADKVYTIEDGEFAIIAEGSYSEYNTVFTYRWNGEEVTKQEYSDCLKDVFDISKAKNIDDETSYTADEIISVINKM